VPQPAYSSVTLTAADAIYLFHTGFFISSGFAEIC
jgi:hypothetical protein